MMEEHKLAIPPLQKLHSRSEYLPFMAKNTYVGQLIGCSLGKVEDIDLAEESIE